MIIFDILSTSSGNTIVLKVFMFISVYIVLNVFMFNVNIFGFQHKHCASG